MYDPPVFYGQFFARNSKKQVLGSSETGKVTKYPNLKIWDVLARGGASNQFCCNPEYKFSKDGVGIILYVKLKI